MPLPELDRPGAPPAKATRLGVERSGGPVQGSSGWRSGGFQWWLSAGGRGLETWSRCASRGSSGLAGRSVPEGRAPKLPATSAPRPCIDGIAHPPHATSTSTFWETLSPFGHLGMPRFGQPCLSAGTAHLIKREEMLQSCRASSVHRPAAEKASYPPPLSTCLGAGSASRLLLRRERGSEGQGGRAWGAASSAALKRPGSANCFFATPPRAGLPSRNAPRAWPAGTGRDFSSSCGLTFTKKATLRDCEACPRDA